MIGADIIQAAVEPMAQPLGWQAFAYGLITKQLLKTMKMVKQSLTELRENKQTSQQSTLDEKM